MSPHRLLLAALLVGAGSMRAQPAGGPIDLPTALRLAGADNLEVGIAREKVAEARAAGDAAKARFFPWITPSLIVRRHDANVQAVNGPVIDADKQSFAAGVALTAQIELGEARYQELAARQQVRAAEAALVGRQRDAVLRAAVAYFELARARSVADATEESARVASRHAEQIAATAAAGLTFKGDAARVQAAAERANLAVSRAKAEQRMAAARLAEILRLDPAVEL
ncbi:MAG: TolC family protein, partial [Opitutaceae bacterium]